MKRRIAFGNDTLNGASGYSLHVVKCSPAGFFIWPRQGYITCCWAITRSHNSPFYIIRDPSGNHLIACELLNDLINFGDFYVGGTTGYIVKYDAGGDIQWAEGKEDSPKGIHAIGLIFSQSLKDFYF